MRNQAITEMFLAELHEKHLVEPAPWLQAALHRHGLDYRYENTVIGTAPNVSSEN